MDTNHLTIVHAPRVGDPQWGPACLPLEEATIADRPQAVTCLACQRLLLEQGYPGHFALPGDAVRVMRGAVLCVPSEVDGYLAQFRREARGASLEAIGSVRTEIDHPDLGELVQLHLIATDSEDRTAQECTLIQCAIDGVMEASGFDPPSWSHGRVARKLD